MIQVPMQAGHKPDKQDMVPDVREIMHSWYGTFMGHIGHKLDERQWGQNFLLIEKVKDLPSRPWYMQKSEYELPRALPDRLESALPTIEETEAELGGTGVEDGE